MRKSDSGGMSSTSFTPRFNPRWMPPVGYRGQLRGPVTSRLGIPSGTWLTVLKLRGFKVRVRLDSGQVLSVELAEVCRPDVKGEIEVTPCQKS